MQLQMAKKEIMNWFWFKKIYVVRTFSPAPFLPAGGEGFLDD